MHIYEPVYTKVNYLKGKSNHFLSWICPLLKIQISAPNEYIFYEGDSINGIYFVKSGSCSYVLPKYTNQPYVEILTRTCFGVVDIIADCFEKNTGHH